VHTTADVQIIFIDTPGLHRKAGKAMNRMMNRAASSALGDADVVLFVTEAGRWTEEDGDVLRKLGSVKAPVVAVLNKVDLVKPRERLLELIAEMAGRLEFADIVPLSAKQHDNLDALMKLLPGYLPESPPLFPEEMQTDRGIEFRIAEVIREKLTLSLHQEIPYGLTVQVERFDSDADGASINAVIWVERDSQKGIVVGKGGNVLKRVGREARLELKQMLGQPVHLELWAKVKDNWADNEQDLMRLGFDES
jgi:GTP-binding protein Era